MSSFCKEVRHLRKSPRALIPALENLSQLLGKLIFWKGNFVGGYLVKSIWKFFKGEVMDFLSREVISEPLSWLHLFKGKKGVSKGWFYSEKSMRSVCKLWSFFSPLRSWASPVSLSCLALLYVNFQLIFFLFTKRSQGQGFVMKEYWQGFYGEIAVPFL